jgi:pimeloyl-ACP methyl ester carboxylesterase
VVRIPRAPTWILLSALALSACSPQRGLEAWALLDDLAAVEGPSRLKQSTSEPLREAVAYRIDGRGYQGDLYRPAEGRGAPLVLVPGAAPEGKDDRRLVATAKSLARVRFMVLVPDIESLRRLHVSATDAEEIAAAVRHLAERSGTGSEAAVGIVAISYAAGPAMIAALTPPAGDLVRFVVTIGGYYDLEAVTTFFTTGRYRESPDVPWRYRRPNAYGKWVFLRSNASRLDQPRDRVLLDAMATRKLRDLNADIGDLVPRLGPEARSVYALLANRDPLKVPSLIAALPAPIRTEIATLDLKRRDLSRLGAEAILVHGRDDPIIPETESMALAEALPEGRGHLYLVDNLAHVDLAPAGLGDNLVLLGAAMRLLELRDSVLDEDDP